MVGCGDVVDYSKLQMRDELWYIPNEDTPFTGRAAEFHENGQKKSERNFKDGKLDGLSTRWYENGQKKSKLNFKDGKLDGLSTSWYENGQKKSENNNKVGKLMTAIVWKRNGEKCSDTNVKDGNGVYVMYNEFGMEINRLTYKDGE